MKYLIASLITIGAFASGDLLAQVKPAKYDADSNGKLNNQEFSNYAFKLHNPDISDLDYDSSGEISSKELLGWSKKYWDDIGMVTGGEVSLTHIKTNSEAPKKEAWAFPYEILLRKDSGDVPYIVKTAVADLG